jgi:hypothetical protein
MMKTTFIKILFLSSVIFYFGSCSDAIFYTVTQESPLLDPLIGGSPANFAVFNNDMYVASGKKIFIYRNGGSKWSGWKKLDSFVIQLAATDNSLYALILNKSNGKIILYDNANDSWTDINSAYNVQSIYACENVLFASVRNNDNKYTIYYFDESASNLAEITDTNSDYVLNGAVSDNNYYYLCAYSGIFCVLKNTSPLSAQSDVLGSNYNFTGIIKLNNDYSAAICKNGDLHEINNAVITKAASFNDVRYSTGALALWKRYSTDTMPSLLIAGRKEYYYSTETGYSNGYVEIELDTTGRISTDAQFREPGKNALSSIDNNDRYVSSFGKKLINHIIQTPASVDKNMTMFASTQKDGVWSYKDHGEGIIWNAEE